MDQDPKNPFAQGNQFQFSCEKALTRAKNLLKNILSDYLLAEQLGKLNLAKATVRVFGFKNIAEAKSAVGQTSQSKFDEELDDESREQRHCVHRERLRNYLKDANVELPDETVREIYRHWQPSRGTRLVYDVAHGDDAAHKTPALANWAEWSKDIEAKKLGGEVPTQAWFGSLQNTIKSVPSEFLHGILVPGKSFVLNAIRCYSHDLAAENKGTAELDTAIALTEIAENDGDPMAALELANLLLARQARGEPSDEGDPPELDGKPEIKAAIKRVMAIAPALLAPEFNADNYKSLDLLPAAREVLNSGAEKLRQQVKIEANLPSLTMGEVEKRARNLVRKAWLAVLNPKVRASTLTCEDDYRSFIDLSFAMLITSNRNDEKDGVSVVCDFILHEFVRLLSPNSKPDISVKEVFSSVLKGVEGRVNSGLQKPLRRGAADETWQFTRCEKIELGSNGATLKIDGIDETEIDKCLARDPYLQNNVQGTIELQREMESIGEDDAELKSVYEKEINRLCNRLVAGAVNGNKWMGVLL